MFRIFQIEIQLLVFANLAPRILYAWADLFSQQLQRGEDYRVLQPVYAIWILDNPRRSKGDRFIFVKRIGFLSRPERGSNLSSPALTQGRMA
ncbi:MAG: PD-(D/E)XK nuclease family transposase [Desulfobacterales bacterium]